MLVETREDTMSLIAFYHGVKPDTLRRHYKKKSSGYNQWLQKAHADKYMLFADNLGKHLSIDEVSLTHGELYTFVTNKSGKGRSGTLVASIRGTRSEDIKKVLERIPLKERMKVKEITLDMANNMESAAIGAFPDASLVTDRFHVVKLVIDAVQHVRIKHRWEEIDIENQAIQKAKKDGLLYRQVILSNGDSPKQLLARSRYILAKDKKNWTQNQQERALILFHRYPDIKKAYDHSMKLRVIFELTDRTRAEKQMNKWIGESRTIGIKQFNSTANTIQNNKSNILNFFNNRSTNASAESFNSKIKLFRANLRGVTDTTFFLFRLAKLFA